MQQPSHPDRLCVIFNPTARGDKARSVGRFLRDAGASGDWIPTQGPGTARGLAREAVESGRRRIIAAGGDGTVFEVMNGIADVPDGFGRAALGVLPMGTANVFAHELGMPRDLVRAWRSLEAATVRKVDGGLAEYHDDAGVPRSARFAIVAGAGLDARAVQQVDWKWKRRVGKLAYIAAAMRALLFFQDAVRCTIGGRSFRGRVVLAGNGHLYAGEIDVFRGGRLDSGHLQVSGVDRITPVVLARCLQAFLTGRWGQHSRCASASVESLALESDGPGPVPLQLDGEFVGWLPATLRVLPGAVRVLVPGESGGR